MRKIQFVAGIAACLIALSGCGDSSTRDNPDDAGGGATGSATQGNTTAGDDAGGGTTGGSTQGATTAGGTDAGSTTGGADAGATTGDIASTPGNDSNTAVACSETVPSCDLKTSSCCATGAFPGLKFACSAGTTCAAGGTRAPCDGKEDCGGGQICCLNVDLLSGTAKQGCVGAGKCTGAIAQQLCHTDAECDAGKMCVKGTSFPQWGTCK